MPVLNRMLRYGLVGGTAAAVHISVCCCWAQMRLSRQPHRLRGIGGTVIDEQQMVHLRQGHDPLNEDADHLGFVEAGRHHPHLLAGHQCAVCTV
ncbi:MAG: hypothetical protein CM15mP116_05860 [Synechococcus sp.]|nr:MAG: hypothetical protein CM15mP116_05860 [Synechococcus sp.]